VAGLLSFVWPPCGYRRSRSVKWPPWVRGWSPGPRMVAVHESPPWGRGCSPGSRMAAVVACPIPWALYSRREGVAGPMGPVSPPWGRGRSLGSCMADVGCGRFPGPHTTAVGAWPVRFAFYGRRGCVVGPMGPVWLPWGRGRSNGPCLVVVGAW